jgi:hypothetical protein
MGKMAASSLADLVKMAVKLGFPNLMKIIGFI